MFVGLVILRSIISKVTAGPGNRSFVGSVLKTILK